MRLLLTTDTVGGVWTFTAVLAGELLSRGVEVVLVSFGRAPSAEQQACVKQLKTKGSLHYVASETPLEWMTSNLAAYEDAAPLLLELCSSLQPDALLLSQFCFGALPVNAPKIVIAHSDVLSWAEAVGKAPLTADEWLHTYCSLVKSGLAGADLLVAPTGAALNGMARHYQLPCPTMVIANGRALPESDSVTEPRRLRAVTAGRMWDPAKNLFLLTEVVAPMPLLVAGDAGEDVRDCSNVNVLGYLDQAALTKLFLGSAIYICCSSYEPFGLAPLEAALCGCAVLANDVPSLREVWGDAALYFHDAATLSAALQALVDDPAALAEAQRRSVARAKHFTPEHTADAYLRAIDSVTQVRHRRQAHAA